jgi:hypothetical protein
MRAAGHVMSATYPSSREGLALLGLDEIVRWRCVDHLYSTGRAVKKHSAFKIAHIVAEIYWLRRGLLHKGHARIVSGRSTCMRRELQGSIQSMALSPVSKVVVFRDVRINFYYVIRAPIGIIQHDFLPWAVLGVLVELKLY